MQPSQTNSLINININNNFCSGVNNCNNNNNNYNNHNNNNHNNWWGGPVFINTGLPVIRAWTPGWGPRGGGYWGGGTPSA